jgi:hypothetical protein
MNHLGWAKALIWTIALAITVGRLVVFIAKRRQYKREFRINPLYTRNYKVGGDVHDRS